MPDDHALTLSQAGAARSDFAAILADLDFIKDQLARRPTRKEIAQLMLFTIFGTAGLVLLGIEVLSR